MLGWQRAVKKIGKGTGKYAQKHRNEAHEHLEKCKEVVPAWIMPLHRVFDTVRVSDKPVFDVTIVDEASQCGFEAIPLLGLTKKLVAVGDDQQISPQNIGIEENTIEVLRKKYLFDFEFSDSFHPDTSLFEHAKLRYSRCVTLREHFRCLPQLIAFSNDLCYRGTPLIPLRQDATTLPPLLHFFVEEGYREGNGAYVINQPEAKAVCDKICECCLNPLYEGATMGVITLQGDRQAQIIQEQLLQRLTPEEFEKRKLLCGNLYHFQGDKRDIIFLSMVAAPNERNGSLTREPDKQRFNVAASRARNQMILFHSLKPEECSTTDLRRRLLEFFLTPHQQREIAGISLKDLEQHALRDIRSDVKPPRPFDSWFEVDVARELLRQNLHVSPQYPIAGKRIDFVIEPEHKRLAVECDGDYWHGSEQYERSTTPGTVGTLRMGIFPHSSF